MDNETPIPEPLTNRETEVLACLIDGLSNSEIAERLFLASSTVKWYINQLNQKLGTRNREEIIKRALRLGLLGEDEAEYATARHNLPHQTTPFVGRHTELDQLYTLLTDPNVRLVTILAPGGMGKTRLALEAAQRQLRNFKHGVYFVPLQALSDAEHIIPPIATSTGYHFTNDGREPKQQVLNFLANKQMLLIFDNFEHVLEGSMLLIEILQNAPDVKILATSREKLSLSGETVYSLRGMQFPNRQMSDALEYDAVKLLTQAAKRVKPDWWVTEANVGDVVRLCQLTHGMPLGIVLAAAWLDVYSLGRICDEIEQSADILQTDMRDVPERLRSIRAVFEYSWERLKPSEQQVFMKMSVFRGGCTPRAAEHITGANRRILHALVNKALLTQNQSGRYEVHELLRQYAEVHLEASGEAETLRDAHMAYYVDAVHQREADVRGPRQLEVFNEIEADFENVRAAWQWAMQQGNYEQIDRMAFPITWFTLVRTRFYEGDELFAELIKRLNLKPDKTYRQVLAKLQTHQGSILTSIGQNRRAQSLLRESLAVKREYGNPSEVASCLLNLADACWGQHAEVRQLAEESLLLFSEVGDKWGMAAALLHLGRTSTHSGYHEEAYANFLQSLSLFSEIGDHSSMAMAHLNVGVAAHGLGNLKEAHQHKTQACELYQKVGNKFGMSGALHNLSAFAFAQGDWDAANSYMQQALSLRRDIGNPVKIAGSLNGLALLAFIKGNFQKAEQLANESLVIASDANHSMVIAFPRLILSKVAMIKEDYQAAHRLAQESFVLAQDGGNWDTILSANLQLGHAHCCLEKYDDAESYLLAALETCLVVQNFPELLETVIALAHILYHRGQRHYVAELLGLVFRYPIQLPWLDKHPRLTELRHNLQAELGEEVYNAAWERGKSLDLDDVARELLAEFGSETFE